MHAIGTLYILKNTTAECPHFTTCPQDRGRLNWQETHECELSAVDCCRLQAASRLRYLSRRFRRLPPGCAVSSGCCECGICLAGGTAPLVQCCCGALHPVLVGVERIPHILTTGMSTITSRVEMHCFATIIFHSMNRVHYEEDSINVCSDVALCTTVPQAYVVMHVQGCSLGYK